MIKIFCIFRLRNFKLSEFAKTAKELKKIKLTEEKEQEEKNDKSLKIRELYAVSGKSVSFFKEVNLRCVFFICDFLSL